MMIVHSVRVTTITFALFTVMMCTLTLSGCGNRQKNPYEKQKTLQLDVSPWPQVVSTIHRDTDASTCRRALSQLNSDLLTNNDQKYMPPSLAPEAEKAVASLCRLTPNDLKEISGATYTSLDAHYLAECLYHRDVVRSFDFAGVPPLKQAEILFAWVCRQVVLNPWVSFDQQSRQPQAMPPVTPVYILQRGSGSGLERAFVFLTLLQQANIPACLVGLPDAYDQTWTHNADPAVNPIPHGPFWAVGVLIDQDVFLFEPWRAQPFPGDKGGIATLSQIKAQPELLKSWREDSKQPWNVTPERIQASIPFVSLPISSLAPRFQRLETELRADGPIRLYVNPEAYIKQFVDRAKLLDTRFWNPPPTPDPFSFPRILSAVIPVAEGGSSLIPDLVARYKIDLLPRSLFVVPTGLMPREDDLTDLAAPAFAGKLRDLAIEVFAQAFLTEPTPREQLQRGKYLDVLPSLVEKRKGFAAAVSRIRSDRDRESEIKKWVDKARALTAKQSSLRDSQGVAAGANAASAFQKEFEMFWKEQPQTLTAILDLMVGEAGQGEASYLLALCMHEQAVRAELRASRLASDKQSQQQAAAAQAAEKSKDLWREARDWWLRYETFHEAQDRSFPGRAEHAKRLEQAAALKLAQ